MLEVPECPVCLETYDLYDRTPMILVPCGHSVCSADLVRLSTSNCPTCKTSIRGPIRNYALQQLLESARTMYGENGVGLVPRCADHPTATIEFWCKECRLVLCPKCYLQTHKGHTMLGLEEAFKGQGFELEKAMELGDLAIVKAQERLGTLADQRAKTLASHEALKRDISCHFDLLIELAVRRRNALLKKADQMWIDRVAKLNQEEQAATDTLGNMTNCLKELGALKERENFVLLMQKAPLASQTFASFLTDQASFSSCATSSSSSFSSLLFTPAVKVHWGHAWPEHVAADLSRMGRLTSDSTNDIILGHAVATGDGLKAAVIGQLSTFVLTTFDTEGRRCTKGGEVLQVMVEGLGGPAIPALVKDQGDGRYVVEFTPLHKEEALSTSGGGGSRRREGGGFLASATVSSLSSPSVLQSPAMPTAADGGDIASPSPLMSPGGFCMGSEPMFLRISITCCSPREEQHQQQEGGQGEEEEEDHEDKRRRSGDVDSQDPYHPQQQQQQQQSRLIRSNSNSNSNSNGCYHNNNRGVIGSPFRVRLYPAIQGIHVGAVGQQGARPLHLFGPGSLAVDGDNLWIGDGDNHRIQVLDLSNGGSFVGEYGLATGLRLCSPYGIAVDDAHAFVAERDAHQVSVLNKTTGELVKVIGKEARMRDPLSVAVNDRYIAVTDSSYNRVLLFNKTTGSIMRVFGPTLPPEAGGGIFSCPCDCVFDMLGLLYVTDREASRILVFNTQTGQFVRQIGSHGTGTGEFNHVNRLAIQGNRIYATDRYGNRVLVFNSETGEYIMTFGAGLLKRPNGVAVRGNTVIVADFVQCKLHIFN